MRSALLGLASLACGCFAPAIDEGALRCPDQLCPPGFQCASDGRCYRGALDASALDAADGCTPITCSTVHAECGPLPDRCGGTIECGGCPQGDHCDAKQNCVR